MVKENSDSERGNPLPPIHDLEIFYVHHTTDRIAHTVAFYYTSCGFTMRDRSDDPSHQEQKLYRSVMMIEVIFLSNVTFKSEREREMFYLTTHSTHFIYGYMASEIWLRTILIVRKETRCRHIGYSYRLTARVLLYYLNQNKLQL